MTIEQLSAETGMTVRNIRSYRTLELIPPPHVRDGVGYYGPDHIARLRAVRELQGQGFNLKGIKQLLDASHGPAVVLGLRRLTHAEWAPERSEILSAVELSRRLGGLVLTDELRDEAVAAGMLAVLDDGRYEILSPTMLRIAAVDVRHGVPLSAGLATCQRTRELCTQIARAQIDVFVEYVWRPFERAGYPEERWPEITAAVDALRPLAAEGLLAIFGPTMADAVEETFGRELQRLSTAGGRSLEV